MKVNEAPEKIYLDEDGSWHLINPNRDSIEYTRTDVFIEKVCDYFAPHISDNSGGYDKTFVLENFKNIWRNRV